PLLEMRLEQRADGGEVATESIVAVKCLDTHAGPLCAVAGKDEGDLRITGRRFAGNAARLAACGEELVDGRRDTAAGAALADKTVPERRAAGRSSSHHTVTDRRFGARKKVTVIMQQAFQRRFRMRARHEIATRCGTGRCRTGLGIGNDDVNVGPAKAEGVDARKTRT